MMIHVYVKYRDPKCTSAVYNIRFEVLRAAYAKIMMTQHVRARAFLFDLVRTFSQASARAGGSDLRANMPARLNRMLSAS